MTDEQIKQNAEEYILPLKTLPGADENITFIAAIRVAFITGAHSRDEEIAYLTYRLNDTTEKLQTVIAERDKLRNPWISVEERLPDVGQKVITITNKGKMLLVARTTQPPHKEEGGWRWEHYIGKVTHWMSIPQVEKGE